jgi:hypothetical protein
MPLHGRADCEELNDDGEASCRCATQPTSRSGHPIQSDSCRVARCHLLACPAVPAGGALIGPGSHGVPTSLTELSFRNQRGGTRRRGGLAFDIVRDGPMCPSYVACPVWTGARRLRSSSLTPNPSPGGRGEQEWHGGLTSSARWNCLRLRSSLADFLPRLTGYFQGARGLREKPWGNQCRQDDVRTGGVELH